MKFITQYLINLLGGQGLACDFNKILSISRNYSQFFHESYQLISKNHSESIQVTQSIFLILGGFIILIIFFHASKNNKQKITAILHYLNAIIY